MSEEAPVAIHLAAGQGTRLRPVTNDRPKPLVELNGTSLLERNVETLLSAGVDDQIVVTGYRADQIRDRGFTTVHNPIYDETDMVYSLFCAAEEFPEDRDLLISYGDIVYEQLVVEQLLESGAALCVVIDRAWEELWSARFEDPLSDAETCRFDSKYRLTEIGGEPEHLHEIEGQYIGLLKVRSDHLGAFIETYNKLSEFEGDGGAQSSVEMTHFIHHLVDIGWDVQAVPISGGWVEVDTLEDLELYQSALETNELEEHVSFFKYRGPNSENWD